MQARHIKPSSGENMLDQAKETFTYMSCIGHHKPKENSIIINNNTIITNCLGVLW